MTTEQAKAKSRVNRPDPEEASEVPAFCARPSCRQEYRRASQPGRPQAYCSEICRRTAEKELRQLKARLTHFESVVEQARIDVASHGRGDDTSAPVAQTQQNAAIAVARAEGVLRFTTGSTDPLADELKLLHDATAPLVTKDSGLGQ